MFAIGIALLWVIFIVMIFFEAHRMARRIPRARP